MAAAITHHASLIFNTRDRTRCDADGAPTNKQEKKRKKEKKTRTSSPWLQEDLLVSGFPSPSPRWTTHRGPRPGPCSWDPCRHTRRTQDPIQPGSKRNTGAGTPNGTPRLLAWCDQIRPGRLEALPIIRRPQRGLTACGCRGPALGLGTGQGRQGRQGRQPRKARQVRRRDDVLRVHGRRPSQV